MMLVASSIISSKSSRPWPVFADTSTHGTDPPMPSSSTPSRTSMPRTRSVESELPSRSRLVSTTMQGDWDWWMTFTHSRVCLFTPSSHATTRRVTSLMDEPRMRMEEKAAWPGVSMKVTSCPVCSRVVKALRCCVMPPDSLDSRDASDAPRRRRASSRVVLPWSTWPMTLTMGGRGVALEMSRFLFTSVPASTALKSSWVAMSSRSSPSNTSSMVARFE
mmetsp:Transcript_2414/g.5704  ORF Transcript_2414/g.5704 Transcript_2414/m.5704 type:complete len:219 (+) Transcript_2414:1079-1735(+)